jgi:Bacteriophage translational regulator
MDILRTLLEITITDDDDFLKIKETLTRIGVASKKDKILYQSCHILHKQGRYYLVHFKELFALDGKPSNFSEDDRQRRNSIALLLEEWNLFKIVNKNLIDSKAPLNQIKVLAFKEKADWDLQSKYTIGRKK